MDVIVPIVFPEYQITIGIPRAEVDLFPWATFDNVVVPSYGRRLGNLGHAGVLIVSGALGTAKYYEYGRYDPPANIGIVRRIVIPNAKTKDKKIDPSSLKPALRKIAKLAGQSGRIEGVYIEVDGKYDAIVKYAEAKKMQNGNRRRVAYDLFTNSCIHFVKGAAVAAGAKQPWMVDPRPNSYIGEFRDDYPDLDFVPATDALAIGGLGNF
jgi:hypothetical protein